MHAYVQYVHMRLIFSIHSNAKMKVAGNIRWMSSFLLPSMLKWGFYMIVAFVSLRSCIKKFCLVKKSYLYYSPGGVRIPPPTYSWTPTNYSNSMHISSKLKTRFLYIYTVAQI